MNVLFIVLDQMRADLLTGALADHVDLPHMRALMAGAVSFDNHVTVANPCGPSRASLLTGQYAMNHRSIRNGAPLRGDIPNLATEVRKAGVLPLLFGYTDTTLDPRGRVAADPALRSYEQPMPGFEEIVEMRLEESWPWRADLFAKGYDTPDYADFYVPVAATGQQRRVDDPAFYRAEDSDTAFLTDRFLSHMKARGDQSVLAHLTYIRPHPPLVAPTPYNRMYDPRTLPMPAASLSDANLRAHPFLAAQKPGNWAGSVVDGFPELEETTENIQALRSIYLGLATEVDHHIGRVIAQMKVDRRYDNTLIVLTADHGEMLGDYGIWGKTNIFDAAYRVPLIIRDPRQPQAHGTKVTAPTESVDVMPTILDWLGVSIPNSVNGRSLGDFLAGATPPDWRDYSTSETAFGDPIDLSRWQIAHGLHHRDAALAILRKGRWTLVQFACDYPPILFDSQGAGEARNMATDPDCAAVLLATTQNLLRHRMRYADSTLSDIQITPDGPVGMAAP